MRILIAPMAAMAETSGPFSRAVALCNKLIERNHEVAFCAAEDVNYKNIENIKNYYAPILHRLLDCQCLLVKEYLK